MIGLEKPLWGNERKAKHGAQYRGWAATPGMDIKKPRLKNSAAKRKKKN